jgi:hypothetical protein
VGATSSLMETKRYIDNLFTQMSRLERVFRCLGEKSTVGFLLLDF